MGERGKMRLYDRRSQRLYINASERERFLAAAEQTTPEIYSFCMLLAYTGCRLSEAIHLEAANIQFEARRIAFRTLKQRNHHRTREVVAHPDLLEALLKAHPNVFGVTQSRTLWTRKGRPINPSTGYRWTKRVMKEARIEGPHASPKGLRHGFGVEAIRNGIDLRNLRSWMGHESIETTEIYLQARGREEEELFDRMF